MCVWNGCPRGVGINSLVHLNGEAWRDEVACGRFTIFTVSAHSTAIIMEYSRGSGFLFARRPCQGSRACA